MNTEDLHRNCILFGNWLFENCLITDGDYWWYSLTNSNCTTEQLFLIYLKTLNNE